MTTIAYDSTTGKKYLTSDGKLAGNCPTVGDCSLCSEPTLAPLTVRAFIDGLLDDVSTGCTDLNGDWELTYDPDYSETQCFWFSDVIGQIDPIISDPYDVILMLNLQDDGMGNATRLQLDIVDEATLASGNLSWESAESGFNDCHLWNEFPLTPITFAPPSSCEHDNSTAILNVALQQAVYYYPAEGGAALRDLYGPLWFWETGSGIGTPLNRHIRQTKRVMDRSLGVGDALEKRIAKWGVTGGKGCDCPRIKRALNKLAPEAVLKDLDFWTARVAESGWKKYKALQAIKSITKRQVRSMIAGACEDVIKWRSR